jgi:hypothetical protein
MEKGRFEVNCLYKTKIWVTIHMLSKYYIFKANFHFINENIFCTPFFSF